MLTLLVVATNLQPAVFINVYRLPNDIPVYHLVTQGSEQSSSADYAQAYSCCSLASIVAARILFQEAQSLCPGLHAYFTRAR